ncbi:MAG: FimB/Mfa2 family fimbrial subunit [Bacteroidaceae bacterium]|nr:FimB/Mfa2 family fimbrial subunit [Bacteroidaceae bacterium]
MRTCIPYQHITRTSLMLFTALLIILGCEKPVLDVNGDKPQDTEPNVILRFTQYESEAFARSTTDITAICSRLNIALFDTDGTKVKSVAQKTGDANYGTVALNLDAGTYKLVVAAHNCDGSATISSEDKVTFPNNKVTDTFYYYGDLDVTAEQQSYSLTLTRAVAMFRLVLTDESMPPSVAKMKFYYLGGSSTFCPATGYGIVQSKQTELRTVSEDGVYEIYTMPHSEEDVLTKLTVSALDANDNVVQERVFEDIPVVRNQVTKYTGTFFGSGSIGGGAGSSLRLMAEPEWGAIEAYSF